MSSATESASESPAAPHRGPVVVTVLLWIWHLLLVLGLVLRHYGDPEKFILIGLQMPLLQRLYEMQASIFLPVSLCVSILLGAALAWVVWRSGGPRWIAIASLIIALLFPLYAWMNAEARLFTLLLGTIRVNLLLLVAATSGPLLLA